MKYLMCLFAMICATTMFAQSTGEDEVTYSIKFTPDGWASFSSANAVALPDGVEVYVGLIQKAGQSDDADYYLYLYRVECPTTPENVRYLPCPLNEGSNPVILKSQESGELTLENLGNDDQNLAKNLYEDYSKIPSVGSLIGNKEKEYESDGTGDLHTYVLGYKQTTGAGFYEIQPGKPIPQNKAFIEILSVSATSSPRIKTIIDDDPTLIIENEVLTQCNNDIIYDLNGNVIKHLEAEKIYIKGGKKFLNK